MLRDKNLIPLSHQHQHALALCVRIERASPIPDADLAAWQTEVAQLFQREVSAHFDAEERVLFPAARTFEKLVSPVEELVNEHGELRTSFARAGANEMSAADLAAFARSLSTHVRKEERRLFEQLQEFMGPDELATLGKGLGDALAGVEQACELPSETTKLRGLKR
jgi:iron-sulfur cluster repair protein YtfE (RIC family)